MEHRNLAGLHDLALYGSIEAHPDVRGSVLLSADCEPVVVVNRRLVGTPAEAATLVWAAATIAGGQLGFYALVGRRTFHLRCGTVSGGTDDEQG